MYITKNKVRLHDMDMAGRLYFPRQFRFAYDALEDMVADEEFGLDYVFHKADFVFAVVHCEADYFGVMILGEEIDVHLNIERIGNTSFTVFYQIFRQDKTLLGTVKTVHVVIDKKKGVKMAIPDKLRNHLEKYLI